MSITEQPFFQPLIDCFQQSGVDANALRLRANVELLDAGQRITTYGHTARSFVPVATKMEFLDPFGEVVACATYDSERLSVRTSHPYSVIHEAFDQSIGLHGLLSGQTSLIEVVGRLMRETLEQYGAIMATASGIYPRLDNDPEQIATFQATRFSLDISLGRIIEYLHLDDAWLSSLWQCSESEVKERMYELRYRKHMLEEPFVVHPCSREEYDRLMVSHAAGNGSSLDFSTYYKWYRRSEALFDAAGNVLPETATVMSSAVLGWYQSDKNQENARASASYWANRNFEIHPMHKDRVERFIDTVIQSGGVSPTPSIGME